MTQTTQPDRGATADHPPASRWMVWPFVMIAAIVLGGIFAVWGINGPSYLLDLIAAYCF